MEEEKQLKFIASMFRMAMEEFNNVMGPESLQTIFRLMGEKVGETVEKRLKEEYKIKNWKPEQFAEIFVKDVLNTALGEGGAEITFKNNEFLVKINVCPFQRAGINISNKLFCTYTEGLIETAAKKALGDLNFKSETLKSNGQSSCTFKLKKQ
ncbi:MAG TPA: methanogen output domain 1-containing protein [Candidatus Lokiarchaeia archaeon]